MRNKNYTYGYLGLFLLLAMWGCSQKSNSFLAKAFHNTTARFNAYFLCKERMLVIEQKLRDNHKDDYNRVLHLYPAIDSNFTKSFDEDFKFINERAILAPYKHKNSNYVDDSYILMGKVKMYRVKLDSAEKFFRYVNSNFKDPKAKQEAQLYLIRTFMEGGNERYARIANDYVTRQEPVKGNELLYYKTVAEYLRWTEKYSDMISYVENAIPYEKLKDERARMNYILGQLNKIINNEEEAFAYFLKAQKRNPPYELLFNAKLSALAMASTDTPKELKTVRRTLRRMIKNPNNDEYLDRIYYELALYNYKNKQIDTSLVNLRRSLDSSKGNELQKGYSYLKTAEIYYDEVPYLSKSRNRPKSKYYTLSKQYYDSTLAVVDSTFYNFEPISERQEILERFVDQIVIVERNDSLLRWANMDSTELAAIIEDLAKKEEEKLIAEELANRDKLRQVKLEKELAANSVSSSGGVYDPNAVSTFKFYDPRAIENAKLAFKNKWGDRPLEDNWRRSNKESTFDDSDELNLDSIQNVRDSIALAENAKLDSVLNAPIEIKVDRSKYYADIPFSEIQQSKAHKETEEALYLLGKIYNNELIEREYACETYIRHVDQYPESDHRAEVLYTLAILCRNSELCESDKYVALLKEEYPNDKYTKLIENPNYVADYQVKNQKARTLYNQAYEQYKTGKYADCGRLLKQLVELYPQNDIPDKVDFLTILTLAKKDRMNAYYKGLRRFQVEYKTSEIIPYCDQLIAQYELNNGGEPNMTLDTSYTAKDTSAYYVVSIYQSDSLFYKAAAIDFNKEFLGTYFNNSKFEVKQIELNDDYYIFTFKEFSSLTEGDEFVKKQRSFAEFKEIKSNFSFYSISKANYKVLINTEDVSGYKKYYESKFK